MVHLFDDEVGYSSFAYNDFNYAFLPDDNGSFTSLSGKRLKKVHRWRGNERNTFEADLPQATRVLTDLYLDSDEPSKGHVVLFLDIEVESKKGFPNIEKANNEITSIALKDKVTDEEYVFILDFDGELDNYKTDIEGLTIYNCHSEAELLSTFLNTWEEIGPTIISGWNSDKFDVPYLYRRILLVLGEDEANRLSPIQKIKWSERKEKYIIAGISSLDYLDLYRKFTYNEQPNYRLDTIGQIEVGMGKYEFDGTLDELFENDIKGYLEYNLRDVHIVDKLNDKMKLIELVRGICTVGHVPYEDYDYSSRWLEGALITDLHRKGLIAPNRPERAQKEMSNTNVRFEGAYVKDPAIGLHKWIYSLDLQSLYPSIMMSLNISSETKIGKVISWNPERHLQNKMTEYVVEDEDGNRTTIDKNKFFQFMEDGKFTISSNGILYRTDKVGLLAETLDRWFSERVEYKNKMKDAIKSGDKEKEEYYNMRQHVQKIFLNTIYGGMGLPVFRFYDLDNALAVTASGQDIIKLSAKYVNSQYIKATSNDKDYCKYIDTDSLYFSMLDWYSDLPCQRSQLELTPVKAKQETIDMAKSMENSLNKFYDVMAKQMFFIQNNHRFVIKGETVASAAFFVNKKRYAMQKVFDLETNQDVDKLAIKGLDVVRSSFPAAFRKFMKEVLGDILNATPQNELDDKILSFRDNISSMPIPDVARNIAVKNIDKWVRKDQQLNVYTNKTPIHVKSAINFNLLLRQLDIHTQYRPITNGSKIKYVYLKDNPYRIDTVAFIGDDSDPPQIINLIKDYMDYDKLFIKEFAHKLQDFYSALGFGNIPTNINQNASKWFI